ncbi:hypothetical protein HNP84_000843 [Thermocatellispora tengchongensis]|uniref:Uncharacterized protein n=1 Tax=Thermocatellispora tengchongensis TaxID=1073253 RepID=A0A840P1K9_9ACTN|nr:hypothetical protein [Thermocatellispora tengchongensis]MBB5131137.1 hypothetical protein [Thermocatellispora tengchongensis]
MPALAERVRGRLAAVVVVLAAGVGAGGCAEVAEVSGAVVRVQACQDGIAAATALAESLPGLRARPAELAKALDDTAVRLEEAAEQAGDRTLREALEGLAVSYRDLEAEEPERAADRAARTTAKYLQVITASCAGQ